MSLSNVQAHHVQHEYLKGEILNYEEDEKGTFMDWLNSFSINFYGVDYRVVNE
jgi:hypothetical protein